MDIQAEIAGLPQLMKDLGTANSSEFPWNQIPENFMYLQKIFE